MMRCQEIITANTEQKHLRLYLSQLCVQTNVLRITRNRELQVLLLGHVANTYKTSLLDPIDKPASIFKSIARILDQICTHMKENSALVQQACGKSFVEVFESCTPNKDEKKYISLLFYERLDSIIVGGSDKVAQKAACFSLSQFVKHIIDQEYTTLVEYFCPKIVGLFIRSRCFHFDLTR